MSIVILKIFRTYPPPSKKQNLETYNLIIINLHCTMKNKIYIYLFLCFLINFTGYSQSTVCESLSFQSNKLGKKVSYSIYLPSDYNTSQRTYPVLYLLHGYSDNETNWIHSGQMKSIADQAIAIQEAVPMIIIMPDAWDTWYVGCPVLRS